MKGSSFSCAPDPARLDAIFEALFRGPGSSVGLPEICLCAPHACGLEACPTGCPLRCPGRCSGARRVTRGLRALASSRCAASGIRLGLSTADSRARSHGPYSHHRDAQIASFHGVSSFPDSRRRPRWRGCVPGGREPARRTIAGLHNRARWRRASADRRSAIRESRREARRGLRPWPPCRLPIPA